MVLLIIYNEKNVENKKKIRDFYYPKSTKIDNDPSY
jgi:hypothetical protein